MDIDDAGEYGAVSARGQDEFLAVEDRRQVSLLIAFLLALTGFRGYRALVNRPIPPCQITIIDAKNVNTSLKCFRK